jgi:hypothetical protein
LRPSVLRFRARRPACRIIIGKSFISPIKVGKEISALPGFVLAKRSDILDASDGGEVEI